MIEKDKAAEVFSYMDDDQRQTLLDCFTNQEIKHILDLSLIHISREADMPDSLSMETCRQLWQDSGRNFGRWILTGPLPMICLLYTSALGIKPDDIGGCPVGCLGIPEFGTDFVVQMVAVSYTHLIRAMRLIFADWILCCLAAAQTGSRRSYARIS